MESEKLISNAAALEAFFREEAAKITQVKKVKGRGLMLGLEFDFEVAPLREKLIYEYHIFTGGAKDKFVLRILPSLGVKRNELQQFFVALKAALS